jgi:hypothetical protein
MSLKFTLDENVNDAGHKVTRLVPLENIFLFGDFSVFKLLLIESFESTFPLTVPLGVTSFFVEFSVIKSLLAGFSEFTSPMVFKDNTSYHAR